MSQEHVEVVRAVFAAWNARDMEAVRELYDPDVVMRGVEDWPEPGPYMGRDALMGEWKQIREAWNADLLEPISDFIDAADRVVVRLAWRGVGQGPGMNMEMTTVYMVRKGRIVYQEFFWDHPEALQILGLAE